jgi:hypothetical protein
MNANSQKLTELFNRIPRRHNTDNVKDIYTILDEYEDVLREIEAESEYEQQVAIFFDELEPIRNTIKKSNDNKASKKQKDDYFDEASTAFKDTMQSLMEMYSQ